VKFNEGVTTANGTFAVDTGKFTGRSPKDKYFVDQAPSNSKIWWGNVNQKITGAVFDELYGKVSSHYQNADDIYVFDGFCGANPATRKRVRIITPVGL
jgi:phosphoenolpyruvate carboxykinase (ATP)